jgi:hypothetical protein
MSKLTDGLLAGAAGTTLLNAATYLDMAVRGRQPSSLPEQDVERLAGCAGLSLGDGEQADARKSALGALLGYVTGAGVGALYGLLAPLLRRLPTPLSAGLVGAGAMAATDAASAMLGTTDPRSWSPQDWAADAIPHLAYGVGVVITYDALRRPR